jgi:transcription antitermination factor NusG
VRFGQKRAGADSVGYHPEEAKEFAHGDRIQITQGPFSAYEAVFQTRRVEGRVLVLLEVAGKAANQCQTLPAGAGHSHSIVAGGLPEIS